MERRGGGDRGRWREDVKGGRERERWRGEEVEDESGGEETGKEDTSESTVSYPINQYFNTRPIHP